MEQVFFSWVWIIISDSIKLQKEKKPSNVGIIALLLSWIDNADFNQDEQECL